MDEKEQKAQKKAAFKEAKKTYKAARKEAGKSRKPFVFGMVALCVAACAAGAWGGWYFTSQQAQQQISSQQDQISQLQQQLSDYQQSSSESSQTSQDSSSISQAGASTSSAESSSASSSSSESASEYVGTWTGAMTSTDSANGQCSGAKEHPMTLTITGVESTGQITGEAKVLYHGHSTIASDADLTKGDAMETLTNLSGALTSSGNFEFTSEVPDEPDGSITISATTGSDTSNQTLEVKVTSKYGWNTVTDTYMLTRSNG